MTKQADTLDNQIRAAQADLLRACNEDDKWWDPRALRKTAANGRPGDVMMFALTDLVNQGVLALNDKLWVRRIRSEHEQSKP